MMKKAASIEAAFDFLLNKYLLSKDINLEILFQKKLL